MSQPLIAIAQLSRHINKKLRSRIRGISILSWLHHATVSRRTLFQLAPRNYNFTFTSLFCMLSVRGRDHAQVCVKTGGGRNIVVLPTSTATKIGIGPPLDPTKNQGPQTKSQTNRRNFKVQRLKSLKSLKQQPVYHDVYRRCCTPSPGSLLSWSPLLGPFSESDTDTSFRLMSFPLVPRPCLLDAECSSELVGSCRNNLSYAGFLPCPASLFSVQDQNMERALQLGNPRCSKPSASIGPLQHQRERSGRLRRYACHLSHSEHCLFARSVCVKGTHTKPCPHVISSKK